MKSLIAALAVLFALSAPSVAQPLFAGAPQFEGAGPTLPISCQQVGNYWFLTSAPAGQNTYGCTARSQAGTATWTLQGGTGGGVADPGSNGIVKRTALNVTAAAVAGTDYVVPGGNVATSTALAANPANCAAAGTFPNGVDASGVPENCTALAQRFFGTAAPGSVAGNLPGARFTDTTNHKEYVCNAPSGTAAPACTTVATAEWLQLVTADPSGNVSIGTKFPGGQGLNLSPTGGITGPGAAFGQFTGYPGNPVLSPAAGEDLTAFGTTIKVGATFHMYYQYNISAVAVIGHATSSDGITWTKDAGNNPVLQHAAGGAWDDTSVGTPQVWKEGATWHMLYRGQSSGGGYRGGLANSTDGVTWTRQAVNNCAGTSGNGCVIPKGFVSGGTEDIEPVGVIKVGSTYYSYIDQPGGVSRATGVATSTDLLTWTKDALNPLFTDGRYCADIFQFGGFYYLLINHYVGSSTDTARIEIYRNATPVFYSTTRTYLGIAKSQTAGWDAFALDTPNVLTDDITRSTFSLTNGDIWMYYAGTPTQAHTNFYTGLAISAGGQSFGGVDDSGLLSGNQFYGSLNVTGDITSKGTNGFYIPGGSAGTFFWSTKTELDGHNTDGKLTVQNAARNAGVTFDVTTDSLLNLQNRAGNAAASIKVLNFTQTGNGALSAPAAIGIGTWITGGSATTTKPYWLIEPTGTASSAWSTLGTAFGINADAGCTGFYADWQLAAVSKFSVSCGGNATAQTFTVAGGGAVLGSGLTMAGGASLVWTARSKIDSNADGQLTFYNNAFTDFTRANFGGLTSAFPSEKRFGNAMALRLADDTIPAFATLTACASGGEGARVPISDSSTATWGATITGGGSNHVLAYCNGTNWTVAGK